MRIPCKGNYPFSTSEILITATKTREYDTNISGQIIIFHQPRFPWNKGISLTKPPFGVRSCEVAIIWTEIYVSQIDNNTPPLFFGSTDPHLFIEKNTRKDVQTSLTPTGTCNSTASALLKPHLFSSATRKIMFFFCKCMLHHWEKNIIYIIINNIYIIMASFTLHVYILGVAA